MTAFLAGFLDKNKTPVITRRAMVIQSMIIVFFDIRN